MRHPRVLRKACFKVSLLAFSAERYAAGMPASRTLVAALLLPVLVSPSHCTLPIASAVNAVVSPSAPNSLSYFLITVDSSILKGAPASTCTSSRFGPNMMAYMPLRKAPRLGAASARLVPVGGEGVLFAAGGQGEGTGGARGADRGPGGHTVLVVRTHCRAGVSCTTRRHAFSSQTCVSGLGQWPARDGPAPNRGLLIVRLCPAISTKYFGGLGWPGAGPQGCRSAARWAAWVPVALLPCTARRFSCMFLWPCINKDMGARRVGGCTAAAANDGQHMRGKGGTVRHRGHGIGQRLACTC